MYSTRESAHRAAHKLFQLAAMASALSCGDDGADPDIPLPDLEVRYRTSYVDISTVGDTPICAGTLALLDAHVEHVLDTLDLELSHRLRVYHRSPGEPNSIFDAWCQTTHPWDGCYDVDADSSFTTNYSLPHEVTHALTIGVVGRRSRWAEPVAEAFSNKIPLPDFNGQWSYFETLAVYALGHLAQWMIEEYGGATFMELFVRTPKDADQVETEAAVREVLGVELPDLISEYAASAPYLYPNHWLCYVPPGAVESPWEGDYWEHQVTLDCDRPDTFSDSDREQSRMTARIPVSIPRAGPYRFLADHSDAELFIQPCPTEPIMEPTPGAHKWPISPGDNLILGPSTLEPGPYVLLVNIPQGEPSTVRLIGYLAAD